MSSFLLRKFKSREDGDPQNEYRKGFCFFTPPVFFKPPLTREVLYK